MASGIEAQNGSWRGAESTCIVSNGVIVWVVVAGVPWLYGVLLEEVRSGAVGKEGGALCWGVDIFNS